MSRIKSLGPRLLESLLHRIPAQAYKILRHSKADQASITWPSTYAWQQAAGWLEPLRKGFESLILVHRADIPSPCPGVYHFDFNLSGATYRIAVDNADHTEVDSSQAHTVAAYFKMQYRNGGYGLPNVFPGGFVPASRNIYAYLPYLRYLRNEQDFTNDVTGRFGLQFAESVRKRAVEILTDQNRLRFSGGGKIRYSHSLKEIARSKVCLDLPGNGPLCFRLIDYCAIGACIIAYPHAAELPQPLVDGVHVVYMKEDMSDLLELCEYYCNTPSEREILCLGSRSYFDRHLHNHQLAQYYLSTILAIISQSHKCIPCQHYV